jgi:uncharacterized protein YcbX
MIVGTVCEVWRYPVKSMAGEKLDACAVTSAGLQADRGWALRDESTGEIRGAKKWPVLMQCSSTYREQPNGESIPHVSMQFPDGATVESDDPNISARISELVRQPVTLWPVQPASNKAHYRRRQPGASFVGFMGRSKTLRRILQSVVPYTPMNSQLRGEFSREPGEPIPDLVDLPAELFEFATPPGTYFDAFPIHILTTATLDAMRKVNPSAAWDVRRFRPNIVIETVPEIVGLAESEWAGRQLRVGNLAFKCTIPTVRCGMTMHAQADLPKDPSILRSIVRDAAQNLGVYASVSAGGRVSVGEKVELI